MPPPVPPLPGMPPPSPVSGEAPTGMDIEHRIEATQQRNATVRSMTWEEHEQLLKAAVGPLETNINQLQVLCEGATKDKQNLTDEVSRLTGLADALQYEASDAVPPLPAAGSGASQSRTVHDVEDVAETDSTPCFNGYVCP